MTRYKKTMQGLKCCSYASKRGCEDCPYLREQIEGCIERCTMSLAEDTLELLMKEQEPKAPIKAQKIETAEGGFTTEVWTAYSCPWCKRMIAKGLSQHFPYCMWCGQAVKWDV